MVETWYPWAMNVSRKFLRRWRRYSDEITSAAGLGLINAVCRFDPAKSANFEMFALVNIYRQIRRDIRKWEYHRHAVNALVTRVIERNELL